MRWRRDVGGYESCWMIARVRCIAFGLVVLVAAAGAPQLLRAAAIADEDVRVTHFEEMSYSPLAHIAAPNGGVVVIRVSLSKSGAVIAATPLSGRRGLIDECVKNARMWTFDPGKSLEAIIVYVFEIDGVCQECRGSSVFHPPNLMVITSGQRVATP